MLHYPMKKTTLYLPAELHQTLKETAKRERRSQAEVVRKALTAYLKNRGTPLPRSIGAVSDGRISGEESEDWLQKNW